MMKKGWFWLALSPCVMLLLPWLAVTFVEPRGGMMATMLLFICVNPVYCFLVSFWAGKKIHSRWWVPAALSALFLAGSWLLFELWEPDFLIYMAIYFAIGMEAMLFSRLVTVRRERDG